MSRRIGRRRFASLAAAALAGGAILPRAAWAAARRRFGGRFVAALLEEGRPTLGSADPRTLDPHAARTRLERELAAALHATLLPPAGPLLRLAGNERGAPPGAWPLVRERTRDRDDPRRWRLALRPGLAFADGSPLRAGEAAASLARGREAPGGRVLRALLARAEADGDGVLVVETASPLADLGPLLSLPGSAIVSPKPPASRFGPSGAGPFVPDEAASVGESIAFRANPTSAVGRAFLDALVFVRRLEGSAAAAALRRGDVHLAGGDAATPAAERLLGEPASTAVLVLHERLSPELRARIAGAPARKVLSDVFLPLRGTPAVTLLPPAWHGALAARDASGEVPPRKSPIRPKVTASVSLAVADGSPELRAVAERLVWDLLDVGVAAKIGWRTPSALEEHARTDRWDLLLTEWSPGIDDPGFALAALGEDPVLPAADAGALAAIADPDARAAAARAFEDRLRAAGRVVPLVHLRRVLRVAPGVEGMRILPDGRVDWAEAGLRQVSRK